MPLFVLACLAYVGAAIPPSILGVVWPSMRVSLHEPVGALGILLPFAITAELVSSASAGPVLSRVRVGPLLAGSTALSAVGLSVFSLAPSLWIGAGAMVLGGTSFGLIDSSLNAFAARHFSAREISWMHATYGLGAMAGPLVATAVLGSGAGWRWVYAIVAVVEATLAAAFVLTASRWTSGPSGAPVATPGHPSSLRQAGESRHPRAKVVLVITSLVIFAAQTGVESGIGLWGFIFLTAGRGLPERLAGLTISGYWAAIFVGRLVLGPVAQRLGPSRLLSGAVACVLVGTALMTVAAAGPVAAAGILIVGLAAAPVFPLLTLTTGQRVGQDDLTRTVTYQVAASTLGGAGLSAGIGLLIGGLDAGVLAPSLLALAAAVCVSSVLSSRTARASRTG